MRFAGIIEWAEGYNKRGSYSPIGQLFHWGMAAAFVYQLAFGWWLGRQHVGADKYLGYQLHGTIGMTIMVVAALRFLWRSRIAGPELVDDDTFSGKASALLQYFFYVCFFGLPITGWVMWSTFPGELSLSIAGLITVPNLPFHELSPGLQAELMRYGTNLHQVLIWGAMLAVPGHAGAAILHHFVKGDRVLESMIPDLNGPEVEGVVGAGKGKG